MKFVTVLQVNNHPINSQKLEVPNERSVISFVERKDLMIYNKYIIKQNYENEEIFQDL